MDILHLVDRLEALVTEGFHMPFTSNVIVHEDEILDIIDQMRVSIPEEVKLARRTEAERERMLMQAQEEADRLVGLAREKAEALTDDHELITFAKERAAEIEAEAKRSAESIIADADDYIIDQLGELEEQLMKTLTTVRNGLRYVQETQASKSAMVEEDMPDLEREKDKEEEHQP